MTFKYSGSKRRTAAKYPRPQSDVVVEPFVGSAAYSMHYRPKRFHIADASVEIRSLWEWLRIAQPTDLALLESAVRGAGRIDVRSLGLDKGPETLVRLTCTGLYLGTLSSWLIYPQHKINFTDIDLPYIQSALGEVLSDFRDCTMSGWYFGDPPYLNTSGGYAKAEPVSSQEIRAFVEDRMGIMTYGTDAPERFPDLEWHVAEVRKVTRGRAGGSKQRIEHWAHLPGAAQ